MNELERFLQPGEDAILVRYPFVRPPLLAHVVVDPGLYQMLREVRSTPRSERRNAMRSIAHALAGYAALLGQGRASEPDHRRAVNDVGLWWLGEYVAGRGADHVIAGGMPTKTVDVRQAFGAAPPPARRAPPRGRGRRR